MPRFAVALLVALMLILPAGSQARVEPYPGIVPPWHHHPAAARPAHPLAATTLSAAPTWTVAILGAGVGMLAFGGAGLYAGRASVRRYAR